MEVFISHIDFFFVLAMCKQLAEKLKKKKMTKDKGDRPPKHPHIKGVGRYGNRRHDHGGPAATFPVWLRAPPFFF